MVVASNEKFYRIVSVRTFRCRCIRSPKPGYGSTGNASPTLPAEPPHTRSVRTVAREGRLASGVPIPIVSLWFVRLVSGGRAPVNSLAVAGFPHLGRG